MKTELGTEFVFHLLSGRAAASPRTLIALFLPFILSRYSNVAITGNNRAKKQSALALKMSVNNFEVSLSETQQRVEQCTRDAPLILLLQSQTLTIRVKTAPFGSSFWPRTAHLDRKRYVKQTTTIFHMPFSVSVCVWWWCCRHFSS